MKKIIALGMWLASVVGMPASGWAQSPPSGVCARGLVENWNAGTPYTGDLYSASDGAYFEMRGGVAGCVENFDDVRQWNRLYRTPESSWRNAGYQDACNVNQPYTKFWMAADLLHRAVDYGEVGEGEIRLSPAFHDSRWDYGPLTRGMVFGICRGCPEKWHKGFESLFSNSYELIGHWNSTFPGFFDVVTLQWSNNREVASYCSLFDSVPRPNTGEPLSTANLAVRGGVLVHEAWHARYEGSERLGSHRPNPGPFQAGTIPTRDNPCQFDKCDRFIAHTKTAPPGGMYHVGMMPYQAELHFQCDVLDASRSWVPLAVMEDMADEHDNLMTAFLFRPPFDCGTPEPIIGGGRRTFLCPSIGTGPGVECTTELDCPPAGSRVPECRESCCRYRLVR